MTKQYYRYEPFALTKLKILMLISSPNARRAPYKCDLPKNTTAILYTIVGLLLPLVTQAQSPVREPGWVQGKEYQLKIEVFHSDTIITNPVIVVALHGDSPFQNPDYHNLFAARVAADMQNVIAIGILRPGYTNREGYTSDGVRGVTNGDNWNAENTDAIADAIRTLKNRYESEYVVVAGHSGGAAITASILGRQPELIDAALLVSCPCDVKKWRENMLRSTGNDLFEGAIDTLSPIEHIAGISDQVIIRMIAGSHDEITPLSLSENYRKQAAESGKNIRLVQLEGKEHDIFMEEKVFESLAKLIE